MDKGGGLWSFCLAQKNAAMDLPPEVETSLYACGGIEGLQKRLPSKEAIDTTVSRFRALADSNRLKILALLAVQPLCVCVIRTVLGISDSRLSYHLSILKKDGLIAGSQSGTWIIYRLTEEGERVKEMVPGRKK